MTQSQAQSESQVRQAVFKPSRVPHFSPMTLSLLLINMLSLLALAVALHQRHSHYKQEVASLQHSIEDAHSLQFTFRAQLQAWEDHLDINVAEPADTYLSHFRQHQNEFTALCQRLQQQETEAELASELKIIVALHQQISQQYADSFPSVSQNNLPPEAAATIRRSARPLHLKIDAYYQHVFQYMNLKNDTIWSDLSTYGFMFLIGMLILNLFSLGIAALVAKHSIRQLKNHQQKVHTVMCAAPIGIMLVSKDGNLVESNQQLSDLFGIVDAPFPKDWVNYIHPEDLVDFKQQWSEALRQTRSCYCELRILQRNGNERWLTFHAMPEASPSTDYIVCLTDISNAKNIENLLRNNEERLRTILQSLADAVIATDVNGKIVLMNPSAELLTAWNLNDALNQPIEDVCLILNAKTHAAINNPVSEAIAQLDIIDLDAELLLLAQDDSEHYITGNATPIFNDQDQLTGAVLVFRDISNQITLQHQLRHADKMQSIGQLTGGIAHDFNNMLGAIMGATQVLDTLLAPEDIEKREYIQIIMRVSENAADLVRNLLAFSRKTASTESTIDINNLIQETADIARHAITKQISLTCTTVNSACYCLGDQAAIQSMLLNLCINARDAMPSGGTLSINTSIQHLQQDDWVHDFPLLCSGPFIKIAVTDTGCGMEPDLINRIFEPFFTTKERGKGTGLGLSTVYGTINSHAGCVNVFSKVGHGSTFNLYLPLVPSSKNLSSAARLAIPQSPPRNSILLVDDDDNLRPIIKSLVESLGYHVLAAGSGQVAITLLEEHKQRIEVVLLDLVMPQMSGRETFEALRQLNPQLKVILISGYDRGADSDHLLAAGAVAYLRKPFSMQLLSELLEEHAAPPPRFL